VIEFKLPSLGADMDEGELLEWKVRPGDVVRKGQVVALVDTSKAAVDVECWQDGTVYELAVMPGKRKIPVGTVLAILLEPGERPGGAKPAPEPTIAVAGATARRRMVSPAARKHAQDRNVDIECVTGTGPQGAVTLQDVERAASEAASLGPVVPTGRKSAEMRKAIAGAMARSKREIPHYYVAETIPMGKALDWLAQRNARSSLAQRLLPVVLLMKAVALSVARFPEFNGFFRDGAFQPAPKVHIGVAISLRQGGLAAPALLDADTKPVSQLMRELSDLVSRCRAGSLRSSEMSEPTITVTNLGDQGTQEVFGVIYPPQVALVGFGRIEERPLIESGGLRITPAVTASLSADHRVSDGHRGALFLIDLRERLQQPEELDR
jgi:pyruvate dehydrogenase E2 component (dihydrolipoamide acetyltransferase)